MPTLQREAVALLIRHPQEEGWVLAVKRPDEPGEELPGIWGLPAGTCLPSEGLEEAAHRTARQKLGLPLQALQALATGTQERSWGLLALTLYKGVPVEPAPRLPDASKQIAGSTYYTDWR